MASEHWFRWFHGTVTDPKWRVIASRCVTNVTVGHVVTIWAAMLENASQASPRGQLQGWDDEDIAVLFGYTTEQVLAIRQAMQGKVLDGDTLLAWEKRQPKREDSSAERTREWRNRKCDAVTSGDADVTQGDAKKRAVTLETETETEKKKKEQKQRQPQAALSVELPDWIDREAWDGFAAMRKRERHPLTDRAGKLVVNELRKLRGEGHDPNAVLDQSTRNGWRDVFPIKPPASGKGKPSAAPDYLVGAV